MKMEHFFINVDEGGGGMANLQIKNLDDRFYSQIKLLADSENRSISQQVVFLIKEYLTKRKSISRIQTPAQVLLDLSGSWLEDDEADDIISNIKKHRSKSKKLARGF